MAESPLRIGSPRRSRGGDGVFIGPGPRLSPGRRGERWDLWESFDKAPGTPDPTTIFLHNGFTNKTFVNDAPMPAGHRNGYLKVSRGSAGSGSFSWLPFENYLGATVDGPGVNTGIEFIHHTRVNFATVGANHHRSPRPATITPTGGLLTRHLNASEQNIATHSDDAGTETLSVSRSGPFNWSTGWVWHRIRIVNRRMWLKVWQDNIPEPAAWLFEDYDTSVHANKPQNDYIYRIGEWHQDATLVGLGFYGVRFLNWPRVLLIQHDFPMSGQTFNCPMSCVIDVRFTYETGKALDVFFRRLDGDHTLYVRIDEDGAVKLIQDNAGETELASASAVFTNGQWAVVRIEANGKYIKVYANDALVINHSTTFQISQAGGLIEHDYATNDIMLKVYS